MAYEPTKTHYGIGIAILIAILIWVGYKYWGWFEGTKPAEKKDGDACVDSNGNPSTIENGACKEIVRPDPDGGNGGGSSGNANTQA